MSNFLEINNLTKQYGDYLANNNIDLSIAKGTIFGLLGPNGAGKTTLIRTITQIIGIDSGSILFEGKPLKPSDTARIGYMPEERGLYKKMKVGEQLIYLARLKDLSKTTAKKLIHEWMERFEIGSWWDKRVEELSKGMQQKIQFIATVVHQPELIILDEPFSGLDPLNTNLIKDEIHRLKENGATIIFSTHRMEQVEEICEQIALINKGKKILDGSVSGLKQQFKQNIYELKYSGDLPNPLPEFSQLIDKKDDIVRFKLNSADQSNDLLQFLLNKQVPIQAYNEILPSLNEIFIKQVEQD